ncbi:MAG: imidazoleglycerol-phosphate dehydratase [Spirochaetes bacterium GWF1_41_5]|nr:MAG: imidazoleglycerol-phosphate dehydratase [Spirochaetes bacterium GWF1_41_5]
MRKTSRIRKTRETAIEAALCLDGCGNSVIDTPVPFFNHMLELFSRHSGFDLEIKATGDIEVDSHHLIEDTGIVLGECFSQCLGDKKGIERYANIQVPMDETLAGSVVDISGRAYLVFRGEIPRERIGNFDTEVVEDFFQAFVNNAKITLHLTLHYGKNSHHIIEAFFKAFAQSLKKAAAVTGDRIPSTKEIL